MIFMKHSVRQLEINSTVRDYTILGSFDLHENQNFHNNHILASICVTTGSIIYDNRNL